MTATIHHGDCLHVMPTLEARSFDAVITDPPYHLTSIAKRFGKEGSAPANGAAFGRHSAGFMGKEWDGGGIAFDPATWAHCLRVLKPGGHLVAFGGSRTWHRMAVAIEDAGFEIRDSLAWLYGSGFPKSHDIAKQIDKMNGRPEPDDNFRAYLRAAIAAQGMTQADVDRHCGTNGMVGHWVGKSQPEYPTVKQWRTLTERLELDGSYDHLIEWAEAQREIIGERSVVDGHPYATGPTFAGKTAGRATVPVTAAATAAAEQWEGWGTALKPCFEGIILARKPISERSVAANVLRWGVGALNVDACRVDGGDRPLIESRSEVSVSTYGDGVNGSRAAGTTSEGRWPGNVLVDEEAATLLDAEADVEGGASRFFYTAKASSAERLGGNRGRSASEHPTTKPIALMGWLAKLITPLTVASKPGRILDPFLGSGSTALAAIGNGFECVGIEREDGYVAIAEQRIGLGVTTIRHPQTTLFPEDALTADVIAEFSHPEG